jgi:hypothetical protein
MRPEEIQAVEGAGRDALDPVDDLGHGVVGRVGGRLVGVLVRGVHHGPDRPLAGAGLLHFLAEPHRRRRAGC